MFAEFVRTAVLSRRVGDSVWSERGSGLHCSSVPEFQSRASGARCGQYSDRQLGSDSKYAAHHLMRYVADF